MAPRVFFITGTSTGFGKHYAETVLENGDICVATSRDPSKLKFSGTSAKNFLAVPVDTTKPITVLEAFNKAMSAFGRIDVVVNNAGSGLSGEFESLTAEEIREQMETNFFGPIEVTKAAMAVMREYNRPMGGVIQQVTSVAAQVAAPYFSIYCASKYALEGFTEAVAKEVKPEWGIKFTCVEPGYFRTDWSGRSLMIHSQKNAAYDHMDARTKAEDTHMNQRGDPAKAAKAMYQLSLEENPPLRCVLGPDAYELVSKKLEEQKKSMEQFADLSNSTDLRRPSTGLNGLS